jgi:hypothetical protein
MAGQVAGGSCPDGPPRTLISTGGCGDCVRQLEAAADGDIGDPAALGRHDDGDLVECWQPGAGPIEPGWHNAAQSASTVVSRVRAIFAVRFPCGDVIRPGAGCVLRCSPAPRSYPVATVTWPSRRAAGWAGWRGRKTARATGLEPAACHPRPPAMHGAPGRATGQQFRTGAAHRIGATASRRSRWSPAIIDVGARRNRNCPRVGTGCAPGRRGHCRAGQDRSGHAEH